MRNVAEHSDTVMEYIDTYLTLTEQLNQFNKIYQTQLQKMTTI